MSVPAGIDVRPERVDAELLWSLFRRFVAADTFARIGENRIAPDDERLATFAHEVAAPVLDELGADVRVDRLNNVLARFGEDRGSELLLVSYPALHHGNEMPDPLVARHDERDGEERWIGLGASQGKGAFAAVCAAVRLLGDQGVELAGRVSIAVCSEGGSSHVGSTSLYEGFSRLPAGAVLTVGTGNRISLGNRGRVDVVLEIQGRATHSSSPELGQNPIPIVADVQERLARVALGSSRHPALGKPALTPYKLVCGPVAPHTIPEWCTLVLDRRTLPGEDEDEVVAGIAHALADLPVTVSKGASMLPALVDEGDRVVVALQEGARLALGGSLETFFPPYTFDAGYACSLGVPTVMCGPSSTDFGGPNVLGEDYVLVRHLRQAAACYAGAVAANPNA